MGGTSAQSTEQERPELRQLGKPRAVKACVSRPANPQQRRSLLRPILPETQGTYKLHVASSLHVRPWAVLFPVRLHTLPLNAAQALNSVRRKASEDRMQVHNLHCPPVRPLWSLSVARMRPDETTLQPLSSAHPDLLSQGFLGHLSLLWGLLLSPDWEFLCSSTGWYLPEEWSCH